MAKFFHTPKAKRFNFKPRFYNEAEEQRKERFAKIEQEVLSEKNAQDGKIYKPVSVIKFARRERKSSNLRVLLILTALLLLFYILFR